MNFTKEQQRIFEFVTNESGHGIIDAVAGAGKTTTIIACANHVPDKKNILFCAFNTSISAEIKHKFISQGLHDVTVKTLHSMGLAMLTQDVHFGRNLKLENEKYASILKTKTIQYQIKPFFDEIMLLRGFNPEDDTDRNANYEMRKIENEISRKLIDINQKYRSILEKEDIEEFRKMLIHFRIYESHEVEKTTFPRELIAVFECHKIILQEGNELAKNHQIIDYTDMLYLPYIWNLHPIKKYKFLFIDECQDLSKSQFAIAAKYGASDGRILAVGDPKQSIYGFTGADVDSFGRVRRYTKASQLPLTTCFRCPQLVINLAKEIRTDITGSKTDPGKVIDIPLEKVLESCRADDLIISRTKAPILPLVFSFIDQERKVEIHKDEVIDFLYELRKIFLREELTTFFYATGFNFEIFKSRIKDRWDNKIHAEARKIMNSTERDIYIRNEKNHISQTLDFFHKKQIQWAARCKTIEDILKVIKEYISSKEDSVKISTIHRAKGLEADRVFVLNYDRLPEIKDRQNAWEMEQEINLKYVAITRAKRELYRVQDVKTEELKKEGSLFDILPFD
jgi:DNA helicase-2/ATP-dependent DNA helicase PcrA